MECPSPHTVGPETSGAGGGARTWKDRREGQEARPSGSAASDMLTDHDDSVMGVVGVSRPLLTVFHVIHPETIVTYASRMAVMGDDWTRCPVCLAVLDRRSRSARAWNTE